MTWHAFLLTPPQRSGRRSMSLAGQAQSGLSASGKHGSLVRLWSEDICQRELYQQLAGSKELIPLSSLQA